MCGTRPQARAFRGPGPTEEAAPPALLRGVGVPARLGVTPAPPSNTPTAQQETGLSQAFVLGSPRASGPALSPLKRGEVTTYRRDPSGSLPTCAGRCREESPQTGPWTGPPPLRPGGPPAAVFSWPSRNCPLWNGERRFPRINPAPRPGGLNGSSRPGGFPAPSLVTSLSTMDSVKEKQPK